MKTLVAAVIIALAGAQFAGEPPRPARCPAPVQVVWNPLWSYNPRGIGDRMNDRRRLTREERIAVLEAQLLDPYRNPWFDSELRREIARLKK